MQYMVLCRETKAEGAPRDQVTVATQRVFADYAAALHYSKGIAPGRRPMVVAIVEPEAGPR